MKLRFLLLLIFVGIFYTLTLAQNSMKNSVTLDWGYGHLSRQNLSFSPLINKGWTPMNAQITYEHLGHWNHGANIRFGLYKTMYNEPYTFYWDDFDNNYESFPNQYVLLDVNYTISKAIDSSDKWIFYIGARERNRLQVADYARGFVTHFSYLFLFGIDANVAFEYAIYNKHNLRVNTYIPVFSHESRPPWASQDGQYFYNTRSHRPLTTVWEYIKGGSLKSWKTSQLFDLDIAYGYQLNKRWSIGAKYLLSMNFSQDPRPLNSIENVFYFTSKYHF